MPELFGLAKMAGLSYNQTVREKRHSGGSIHGLQDF
jgi:hypothetical protein